MTTWVDSDKRVQERELSWGFISVGSFDSEGDGRVYRVDVIEIFCELL